MIHFASPLPPLQREEVENRCTSAGVASEDLALLRWLIWLPLLSREELARVTRRKSTTLWKHLAQCLKLGLIDEVILNERGAQQQRYYLTDVGLYVLAALHPEPLSVRLLAMSYPITRLDLCERLARPQVHLTLSTFVTRLLSEHPPAITLQSYQQPYSERYLDTQGKGHTIRFDAGLLLQAREGTLHAFYVLVDQTEHLFNHQAITRFLSKLLALRQATHLRNELMPHLLLLSSRERFSFWADHLSRKTLPQGTVLLDTATTDERVRAYMDLSCLIADARDLSHGAFAPIWTPFHALIEQRGIPMVEHQASLDRFLERVASSHRVEQFSQYFSFRRALGSPSPPHPPQLPRYVDISLQAEAAPLGICATPQIRPPRTNEHASSTDLATQLLDGFYSGPPDRHLVCTLLTLALSAQQKALLIHLVHHPYLSMEDLLVLLRIRDERSLRRQLTPLLRLKLVKVYPWSTAPTWQERERYYASETALRFLAQRHGLAPAAYLEPAYTSTLQHHAASDDEDSAGHTRLSPLARDVTWFQRGARGLRGKQIHHTSGVYRCVRHILATAQRTQAYTIRYWKSAREAQRLYVDPLTSESEKIRPDTELLYTLPTNPTLQALLIEYDRGTMHIQALYEKLACYVAYQQSTHTLLPPVLFVTQSERAAQKIQQARLDAQAFEVPLFIVLEDQLIRDGLIPVLGLLG